MGPEATLKLNMPWGYITAKTWGNSKDTSVLLVHGTLDNAGSFDRLIEHLPQAFYYVCIDLPGHGFSSTFEPGVSINFFDYVLTIRYILDELKWNTTYYIGHSLGGSMGLVFSIIYPDRIKKLVLLDSVIEKPIENEELISRIRDMHNISIESSKIKPRLYSKEQVIYALKNLRHSYLNRKAAEALFDRAVIKNNDNDDSYKYTRDYRAKIFLQPLLNIEQYSYLIQKLKVNTLIILSSQSLTFTTEINIKMSNILKKFDFVNVVVVEGNHDVHNNNPERISDYVAKFLSFTASKL